MRYSLFMLTALSACAPTFHPPADTDPHAAVEFQATYHLQSDAFLTQTVSLDGAALRLQVPNRVAKIPLASGIKVRPTRSRWHVASELSHADTVRRRGPMQVQEGRSCPLGLASCGEPRIEERDQWATDYVIEAACEADVDHTFEAGRTYFVQYDFYADRKCTLTVTAR